jgi:amidase
MTTSREDIHYLTIIEVAGLLRTRSLSPVEVTQALPQRIGALDGDLASFCHLTAAPALETARQAEREIAQGRYRGPLHGVPLGIRDLFFTEDASEPERHRPDRSSPSSRISAAPPDDLSIASR